MKVKRKKEEENKNTDLTKKVGIASSSGIGAGIGAASGYGLSEIGKEKIGKKAYKEALETAENDLRNNTLSDLPKEQIEETIRAFRPQHEERAREAAKLAQKSLKRRAKYVLPAAGIGAVIGGVGYKEITKRKGRNRRNENPETK